MTKRKFQLTTVAQVFADAFHITEALGFPELAALGEDQNQGGICLQLKATAFLEDPVLSPAIALHRREHRAEVETDSIVLQFVPPRRSFAWENPLTLRIHFVRWVIEGLYHAYVPALGIHVFASQAALLPKRLEEHSRLALAARDQELTLQRLSDLARVSGLRVGTLEVMAQRKTPRQIAAEEEESETSQSILSLLAKELPPEMPSKAGPAESDGACSFTFARTAYELDTELYQLTEMLVGQRQRSVLLVGPPGCGKTALVGELARRRKELGFGHTPFWSTSGARLMTGRIGHGMWQQRCQDLCREVSKSRAILHLGHLGELLEVGKASQGQQSIGGFLRPWIARGEVLAIAECTPEQVSVIEREEPHLLAAFQQLFIPPRTPEQTYQILNQALATAPGDDDIDAPANQAALARLHQLHQRYASYSANPGRPLRFLRNLLSDIYPRKQLSEAQVIAAFSRETGLPQVLLDDDVPLDPQATSDWFSMRIVGQPRAVQRVVDLLVLIKARLARPCKPLASFLFIGPTGTGKTEMAKSLAGFLFGDPGRLVRFDLNEFSDPVSVQRLIGGPLAHQAEGLLTARIREQPFSVVLLDEFEKADHSFFDLLLQILGEGQLTDAAGRVANFCNSVIVMTSNLGVEGVQRGPTGFRPEGAAASEASSAFTEAVRGFLRPEIYNRLDAIVPFDALTPDSVLAIVQNHLDLLVQRDGVRLRSIRWNMQAEVAPHLARRGYDARYGARPLKRIMERELLVPLAEALNRYQSSTALEVVIGMADGRVHIQVRALLDGTAPRKLEAPDPLVDRIIAQRRRILRLERCAATNSIEDEVAILASITRRFKTTRWETSQVSTQLARLPRLRDCLQEVGKLVQDVCLLETEALSLLYSRESIDSRHFQDALTAMEGRLGKLKRALFREQEDQPDEVLLAFYSDHRNTLLAIALEYYNVCSALGQWVAASYFRYAPNGKTGHVKTVCETTENLKQFLTHPPDNLFGIAMHLKGDLVGTQFKSEAGLHIFRSGAKDRFVLIETPPLPMESYEPPSGLERPGAIAACSFPLRRRYDDDRKVVRDEKLGERKWANETREDWVRMLTRQLLDQAIELATS